MAKPDPSEFVQLPYYSWSSRPETLPLSVDEVATALYLADGDLKAAAATLKVTLWQLKKLVRKTHRLQVLVEQLRAP
jgi:hypothetical protein